MSKLEELAAQVKDKTIYKANFDSVPEEIRNDVRQRVLPLLPEDSVYKRSFEKYLGRITTDIICHIQKEIRLGHLKVANNVVHMQQVHETYSYIFDLQKRASEGTKFNEINEDFTFIPLNLPYIEQVTSLVNEKIGKIDCP
jgi:hypothetical protein